MNTFRWHQYRDACWLNGDMRNYSKAECFRIWNRLQQFVANGVVVKVRRGLYRYA
jgi:hypothetical protein